MKLKSEFEDVEQRDMAILQMVALDSTRKEIAKEFNLSKRTVESIIDKWRFKYECKKEAGLIYLLMKDGIVS